MNLLTILALFTIFLCVCIYIAKRAKNKKIQSFADKNALSKYALVITSTQELLNYSASFPYSREMLILLYKRKLHAIKEVSRLDSSQGKQLQPLLNNTEKEFEQVKNSFKSVDLQMYQLPQREEESLNLLRIIKRLKKVTKMEYADRNITKEIYTQEFGRLDILEMQINIENIIHKAQHAILSQDLSSAKTLLQRGVASLQNKKGTTFVLMRKKLENMLTQI